jgi:hypothetical protein
METQMSDFDFKGFVASMEQMGLKLTAVPLADGKFRVNRWRTAQASEHTQQIEDLWASQIGDRQARMDQLAAYVYLNAPQKTTNRILSGLRKVK